MTHGSCSDFEKIYIKTGNMRMTHVKYLKNYFRKLSSMPCQINKFST